MKNENYQTSFFVDASPANTFDKICKPNDWWGFIKGPSSHLNDEFIYHPNDTWVKFKVTELVPNQKVVWEVTDSHLPFVKDLKEWNNTSVVFELKPTDGFTEVKMEHIGLVPTLECWDGCNTGWNFYLKQSLHKLITEGKGEPGMRGRQ